MQVPLAFFAISALTNLTSPSLVTNLNQILLCHFNLGSWVIFDDYESEQLMEVIMEIWKIKIIKKGLKWNM